MWLMFNRPGFWRTTRVGELYRSVPAYSAFRPPNYLLKLDQEDKESIISAVIQIVISCRQTGAVPQGGTLKVQLLITYQNIQFDRSTNENYCLALEHLDEIGLFTNF